MRTWIMLALLPLFLLPAASAQTPDSAAKPVAEGVTFVAMIHSRADVGDSRTPCQRVRDFFDRSARSHDVTGERPAVCDKVLDITLGKATPEPDEKPTDFRAYGVSTDSRQRVILTEPATRSIHILDFANRKYTRIDGLAQALHFPYATASDSDDNIYVTDRRRGIIAVFRPDGRFKQLIGDYKDEHSFEQPDAIAVDRSSGRIYVADSARHFVLIFDRKGRKLASIGTRGGGTRPSEFRQPTSLTLHAGELYVLDRRNLRIQVFDLDGRFRRQIKVETMNPEAASGMAIDSRGLIYILLDLGIIEVFDQQGHQLSRFGHYGSGVAEFRDAKGIHIDATDRLYVTDTGNERIQVFQLANPLKNNSASR